MDRILETIAPTCGAFALVGWCVLVVAYGLRAAGVLP